MKIESKNKKYKQILNKIENENGKMKNKAEEKPKRVHAQTKKEKQTENLKTNTNAKNEYKKQLVHFEM